MSPELALERAEITDAQAKYWEKCCCRVCSVSHDPAIHAATLRVHEWFREQLSK